MNFKINNIKNPHIFNGKMGEEISQNYFGLN